MKYGIVLFGHGSRDPLWRLPLEAIRDRITLRAPEAQVICAYLELMQPALAEAVAEQVDRGATTIRIVPMFLGVGRHAREDLPLLVTQLNLIHTDIVFDVQPAIGEQEIVINLLAEVALAKLKIEN